MHVMHHDVWNTFRERRLSWYLLFCGMMILVLLVFFFCGCGWQALFVSSFLVGNVNSLWFDFVLGYIIGLTVALISRECLQVIVAYNIVMLHQLVCFLLLWLHQLD